MKYYILLITTLFLFSCGNEKVLQLPEISHSEISEIQDVSHAYLFYDETQKDSVELNRKNLISTTNWLVNVDKRLTLKQAIPHIKYLQDKKANSSHKKVGVKNYFTCNDTNRKNLGFIEFTDIVYSHKAIDYDTKSMPLHANIVILNLNDIRVVTSNNKVIQADNSTIQKVILDLYKLNPYLLFLEFDEHLTFQEYILIKSTLQELYQVKFSKHEIYFN